LPNPELYDTRIKEIFPSFYAGDIFSDDSTLSFTLPQPVDPWIPVRPSTTQYSIDNEYDKIDYRNFFYGETTVQPSGTYFAGSTYYTSYQDLPILRIVGEDYDRYTAIRYRDVVMSTPYIVVEVNKQDFDAFTQPYTDGQGNEFTFTSKETYRIAELLINYILHEVTRPANVKVIMIVAKTELDSDWSISDVLTQTATAQPTSISEIINFTDLETHNATNTNPLVVGTPGLTIGAPSLHLINGMSGTVMPVVGQATVTAPYEVNNTQFTYSMIQSTGTLNAGVYSSVQLHMRTPSTITISSNVTLTIWGKQTHDGVYSSMGSVSAGQTRTYESYDVQYVQLRSSSSLLGVTANVTWFPQAGLTRTPRPPQLILLS
jgi:hypothetical protein